MLSLVTRLRDRSRLRGRDDRGVTVLEYGLLVALVGLTSFAAASFLFGASKATYTNSEQGVGNPKSACIGDEVLVNGECGPNPMVISTVSPIWGPPAGGTTVLITGTSFATTPNPTVTFAGVAATVTAVTTSSVTVVTPAGTVGPADVTVQNNDGNGYRATKFSGFTYATVPGAPAAPSVAAGSGLVSLGWSPPATTGGLPITEYTLQRSPDGTTWGNDTVVTGSNYVWTGLTNGSTYYFRIKAKNLAGYGSYSPASVPATPQASPPSAPIIQSIDSGVQSVSVNFTPPADDGGEDITNYQYSINAGSTWTTRAPAAITTPLVITGLGVGQSYPIVIRAVNGIPTGATSNSVTGTTLGPPPVINTVNPTTGPATGGTSVTISGSGFLAGAQVTIGGSSASVTSVTGTSIVVTTPTKAAGAYDVVVTNTDGQSDTATSGFTYYAGPSATTDAATGSGLSRTLNGTVSSNGASTTVTFCYRLNNTTLWSGNTCLGTEVTADESPLAAGATGADVSNSLTSLAVGTYTYAVKAVNAGGTTRGSNQSFTVTASGPTATTNAATGSGTSRTLNGTVSSNGASTTVTFCYRLNNATLWSGTTCLGTQVTADQSPLAAAASGAAVSDSLTSLATGTYYYAVKAVNSVNTTLGANQSFTVALAPSATTNAASGTGTSRTLNGSVTPNGASTTVTFCYRLNNTTLWSGNTCLGTEVTADQSPLAAGASATAVTDSLTSLAAGTYTYAVKAVNSVNTTLGANQSFTVAARPTLTSITPTTGLTTGGTTITLTGTGFVSGAQVTVGGVAATGESVTNSTTMTAVVPAGTAGARAVVVTNTDGQASTETVNFTYTLPVCGVISGNTQSGFSKNTTYQNVNVFTGTTVTGTITAASRQSGVGTVRLSGGNAQWRPGTGTGTRTAVVAFSYTGTNCSGSSTGTITVTAP